MKSLCFSLDYMKKGVSLRELFDNLQQGDAFFLLRNVRPYRHTFSADRIILKAPVEIVKTKSNLRQTV